jgi:putative phosphoribosyl transferase
MSSMYFKNRADAGKKLAVSLEKYQKENSVVVALSPGASVIGAQVAMNLHANLLLYLIKSIYLPGEIEAIAGLSSTDTFLYNNMFNAGQLEELADEYRGYIEQERINKRHELHVLLGHDGEIDGDLLRRRTVILVADGLPSGFSIDIAAQYLKTIAIHKLVIATPLASVSAVDRMHLVADEIACLAVTDNYMDTNHYYEDNTIPSVPDILKMMRNIAINWKH